MYPRPRLSCFGPRFESSGDAFAAKVTAFTFFDHIHNVVIHLRPIKIASHETLHSIYSQVYRVEISENSVLQFLWYYDPFTIWEDVVTGKYLWYFFVFCCLILVIKSSFIASLFISSSVTGSSLMVLAIMFLISQSVRKTAIIVSSKGSLYFGTNLNSPSAWLILMVLAIMFLISQSLRKVAIIMPSKSSLYFGTNLDSPSAWLICFDGRYSILKL